MIRHYKSNDHTQVAEAFTYAIHQIAIQHYTLEQCLAWSDSTPNYEYWKKRCELKRPFIAEVNNEVAGFLELDTDGHIDCTYVNPTFKRKGVGTKLVNHAIKTAFNLNLTRLYVEASICAEPLFKKLGFKTISKNTVSIKGQNLLNYKMELHKNVV